MPPILDYFLSHNSKEIAFSLLSSCEQAEQLVDQAYMLEPLLGLLYLDICVTATPFQKLSEKFQQSINSDRITPVLPPIFKILHLSLLRKTLALF